MNGTSPATMMIVSKECVASEMPFSSRSGAKPLHSVAQRRRRHIQPRPSAAGALFHNALTLGQPILS
jgi:hypothetical protein